MKSAKVKTLEKNILTEQDDPTNGAKDALADEILIADSVDNAQSETDKKVPKDEPVFIDLEVTLEEVRTGCVRRLEVTRKIYQQFSMFDDDEETEESEQIDKDENDSEFGKFHVEKKRIKVVIEPGTYEGRKFTFDCLGDQYLGREPANLIYVVRYAPHPYFRLIPGTRDVIHIEKIAQREAQNGVQLRIPSLLRKVTYYYYKRVQTHESIKQTGGGLPLAEGNSEHCGNAYVYFQFVADDHKDPDMEHHIRLSLEQLARGYCSRLRLPLGQVLVDGQLKPSFKWVPFGVRAGAADGEKFLISRVGRHNPTTIPADLIVTVHEESHGHFVRKGLNVEYVKTLTESEACKGEFEVEVPTLYGDQRTIFLTSAVKTGKVIVLQRLGLPDMTQEDAYGDLVVRFRVVPDNFVNPFAQLL